jgi:hypothetical protein
VSFLSRWALVSQQRRTASDGVETDDAPEPGDRQGMAITEVTICPWPIREGILLRHIEEGGAWWSDLTQTCGEGPRGPHALGRRGPPRTDATLPRACASGRPRPRVTTERLNIALRGYARTQWAPGSFLFRRRATRARIPLPP